MRLLVLALALAATTACHRIHYTPLADGRLEPLSEEDAVDVVLTRPPRCAYREIALLDAKSASLDRELPRLRKKARAIGANTVWVKSERGQPITALALLVRCRAPLAAK